jgi:putative intracellular protease/amidase
MCHSDMSRVSENKDRQIDVAFVVAPGAELVDIAGPWGVFEYSTSPASGRSPFALSLVAATTEPLALSGGMRVVPERTFADCPSPDLVVVPAIGVDFPDALLDWLRTAHSQAVVTMSVCNSAFALAAAGLLDGRTATCHHGSYRLMQALYLDVIIERGLRWVDHGDIATAGGLTSGTDLALRVVERLLGSEAAQRAASDLEYFGNGWRDPSVNAPFATDPTPPPGLALDPICGMTVSPANAISATMNVGGVQPDVDERLMIQPAGAEHVDVGVDLGADPRHRRLRDPAVATERFHQVVDLPGRGAGDVGGHDHRPQRPIDPPARLEQLREERTLAELGDSDLDITARCRDQLRAMPVALRHTLAGAFAWCGADRRGEFRFDQLLQRHSQDVAQRRRETGIGAEQTRGKVG